MEDNGIISRINGQLLYRYIRGSHLYGLNVKTSDIDTSGVFICKPEDFLGTGIGYKAQVSDSKHDNVLFEIGEYMHLLMKSNPTIMESLFVPKNLIIGEVDKYFEVILEHREDFLSKQMFNGLIGYATQQIQKARGLGKKMMNPITRRLSITDFCYVIENGGSIQLDAWLIRNSMEMRCCGLVNVANARDVYALYYDANNEYGFNGITNEEGSSTQLRLSSVPKGLKPVGYLSYNEDGFRCHCVDYKQYKEWEENRNPIRYQSNLEKNYDAKNMMHCVRLLHMGIELAKGDGFNVQRTHDRDFLLAIRNHKMEYDELLAYTEQKKGEFYEASKASSLREKVDLDMVNELLIDIRKAFLRKIFCFY